MLTLVPEGNFPCEVQYRDVKVVKSRCGRDSRILEMLKDFE